MNALKLLAKNMADFAGGLGEGLRRGLSGRGLRAFELPDGVGTNGFVAETSSCLFFRHMILGKGKRTYTLRMPAFVWKSRSRSSLHRPQTPSLGTVIMTLITVIVIIVTVILMRMIIIITMMIIIVLLLIGLLPILLIPKLPRTPPHTPRMPPCARMRPYMRRYTPLP